MIFYKSESTTGTRIRLEFYNTPTEAQKVLLTKAIHRFDADIKEQIKLLKAQDEINYKGDETSQRCNDFVLSPEHRDYMVFNHKIKIKDSLAQIKEKISEAISFTRTKPESILLYLNVSHEELFSMDDGKALRAYLSDFEKEKSHIGVRYLKPGVVKQKAIYLFIMTMNGGLL